VAVMWMFKLEAVGARRQYN